MILAAILVSTLAGPTNGGGYADGLGPAARLSAPAAAVFCGGAFYFADSGNHVIRRVTESGDVTTWAGRPREEGLQDGDRGSARFRNPRGLAAAADCTLYVGDTGNSAIRVISPGGDVTTRSTAIGAPHDVAIDPAGTLFAIDGAKRVVRSVAADGTATTAVQNLNDPRGLAIDNEGALLIIDFQAHAIKRRATSGNVTTLSLPPSAFPLDAVAAPDGTLYYTDHWSHLVGKLDSSGNASVVAGAAFDFPAGIALHPDGSLLVTDFRGCTLRRVTSDGLVTTIAGSVPATGVVDGDAAAARFSWPVDVAVAADGSAFIADGNRIRRTLADGTTITFAGPDGLTTISALAFAPNGDLIVAEGDAHVIRRVTMSGVVTTIAGSPGKSGLVDGAGPAARFQNPYGVAVAPDGTIYVADTLNRAIRVITGNDVRTIPHDRAVFNTPVGIDVDEQGNAYVWDENFASLTRVARDGATTVLARDVRLAGDGWGLARAAGGTFYLAANASDAIRRIHPNGTIEVFAGGNDSPGNENGAASTARFRWPRGIAIGPNGAIYVTDTANGAVRVIAESAPVTGPRRRAVRH
ncbi:MAG TPA: hypothetical protein VKB93_05105 [Thermoanaerobaculia bacterium]|nr:hypothetical protein [Thermoanaerobaculia bacterium]